MILVVGASGIVGQHMRLYQPSGTQAVYTSRDCQLPRDFPLKLQDPIDVEILLDRWTPDVVVNLAGENRPDVVERDPAAYAYINVTAPTLMAQWCRARTRRFLHVSSQAVLGGTYPPYLPLPVTDEVRLVSGDEPVNAYGLQKLAAETNVLEAGGTVARLTFILGIRPFPHVGRANPAETILEALELKREQRQVADRWFSPAFATEAASWLWYLAQRGAPRVVYQVGHPVRKSRADIALNLAWVAGGGPVVPVAHDTAFPAPAWAPRPRDTTFAVALHRGQWDQWIHQTVRSWRRRLDYLDHTDRAVEIGTFIGIPAAEAEQKLRLGFGAMHGEVAKDFRQWNPEDDDRLLAWYRMTQAYIWELTAYHLDPGFNYFGMCEGIISHLKAHGKRRVLCVGDGVGDLSMKCQDAGLQAIYHDLSGSKTSDFAYFRMRRRFGNTGGPEIALSDGWGAPDDGPPDLEEFRLTGTVDAIVALDFFEHMVDVEGWVRRCFEMLKPGGLFLAQNAFHIGNEPGGSLPMHLTRNDRFEKDWDPLMDAIGYVSTGEGNWRRKP